MIPYDTAKLIIKRFEPYKKIGCWDSHRSRMEICWGHKSYEGQEPVIDYVADQYLHNDIDDIYRRHIEFFYDHLTVNQQNVLIDMIYRIGYGYFDGCGVKVKVDNHQLNDIIEEDFTEYDPLCPRGKERGTFCYNYWIGIL